VELKEYKKLLKKVYTKINKNKEEDRDTINSKISFSSLIPSFEKNKTIIKSFNIFCTSIRRDPLLVLKNVGKDFGSHIKYKDSILIIYNKIEKDDVIKIFERYVDNYIRCSECKSVDTNLIEKYIHCEVCGYEKKTK